MMCKIKRIGLISLLIIIFFYNSCSAAEKKVLILYDSYKTFASDYSNLNNIIKLIMSSKTVDIQVNKLNSSVHNINEYDNLIVLNNENNDYSRNTCEKLSSYKGNILWFNDNCHEVKEAVKNIHMGAAKIAVFKSSVDDYRVRKLIIDEIQDSSNPKNQKYLILNKVYPFIDLNEFVEKVDFLYDKGIPFICEAMPVYENIDFVSMKKFGEALRYAQSKGGRVILKSPIFYMGDPSGEEVMERTQLAFTNYLKYQVYPIAFSIPDSWIYKEEYHPIISISDTIVVEKEQNLNILDFENLHIEAYKKVMEKFDIGNIEAIKKQMNPVGVAISSDYSLSEFKEKINNITDKGIKFDDICEVESRVKLKENEIANKENNIYLNNILQFQGRFLSKAELEEIYSQDKTKEIKDGSSLLDISKINKLILIFTIVVCVVFAIIAYFGGIIDRRKYFK
ncbi:hypothetical protein [Clostridium folliculivorans]|uniref:DUF2334 domain-containing protein n=1 Tax=Clostridium folliculivorans TaxID=2886038 RepID=A0A9W5Y3W7_9CLOT|nr:hypothetical protein [Clostridium folliculivorans]GKU26173.1 hypothetical protein CFOLD11_30000 [Clostridium folliculivorans]GKU31845.1 hypothetical protein CFB3_39530 [Clostridium folliculivorans]